MNDKSLTDILKSQNIRPKKSFGQNFLTDPSILSKIVREAEVKRSDTVLEIGPGPGTLTQHLIEKSKKVIAVEVDERMVSLLVEKKLNHQNLDVIHKDILEVDIDSLVGVEPYLAVANVPYYITSAIFRHLLNTINQPTRIVFTVQKEVAERICELDGSSSLLSLSIRVYGKPRILFYIPASAFTPQPKVDSAVLRVDMYPESLVSRDNLEDFFRITKAGFSQKRKTLKNSLSGGLAKSSNLVDRWLVSAGIDPIRRAETLSINEWRSLIEHIDLLDSY